MVSSYCNYRFVFLSEATCDSKHFAAFRFGAKPFRMAFVSRLGRLLPVFAATVASAPVPIPVGHGINIHFTREQPGELLQIGAGGFSLVRMDAMWADVERSKSVYNFSDYDTLVQSLDANSLKALFILNQGNPLYDNGNAPTSAEAVSAFVNFSIATVARYSGKGFVWEIWNEPDLPTCATDEGEPQLRHSGQQSMLGGWSPCGNATDYGRLAMAVAQAVKQSWPDEVLIGPALGQYWNVSSSVLGPNYPWLNEALAGPGLLAYLDGVSIHPYRPDFPEFSIVTYALMKEWLAAMSPADHVPTLINSECGYSTALIPPTGAALANETAQAYYTVRVRLSNLLVGIPLSISYDYKDDGDNASYIEDRFGLVRETYFNSTVAHEPKPTFVAAAALHAIFDGCSFVGGLQQNFTGPGTKDGIAMCYSAYWDCGTGSPGFAAWCAADYGWSTNLTFPYTWPGDAHLSWEPVHALTPQMLKASAASPSAIRDGSSGARVAAPGPCFYRYLVDGTDTGLVCSDGSNPSSYTWTLEASAQPVYLRNVQIQLK